MMSWVGLLGLVAIVVGAVILGSRWSRYGGNGIFVGGPIFVGGVIIMFVAIWSVDKEKSDRERRTTTVTEAVLETSQTYTKEDGCVQVFRLSHVPYTLEKGCESFVKYSYLPPRVGDVLRVSFIRPKKPDGKPAVLEVENLTQEVARARSTASSAPDASVPN